MTLPNRIVRSATMDNLGSGGLVTDAQVKLYRALGKGEIGLIISHGLFPTVEVEIRDAVGRPVEEGVDGEIFVRGPTVMLEYWRLPDETSRTILPGRWLGTGDIGRREGDHLVPTFLRLAPEERGSLNGLDTAFVEGVNACRTG